MYKILAFIGEAGAGKDSLAKAVIKRNPEFHNIVSCTTRPKREKEVEGIDYHFLTIEEFTNKVLNYEMLEATEFNDWFYGTSIDSLDENKINVGVFNPAGIESLLSRSKEISLYVFWVKASDKTRLMRQLEREDNPNIDEIIRRYKADKMDFDDIDFKYIAINNEDYDLDTVADHVTKYLGQI